MCCAWQGSIRETLRKHAAGFDNWVITTHEADYMSVFGDSAQDLVYLTGGAPATR